MRRYDAQQAGRLTGEETMPIHNIEIAELLNQYADLMEIQGENAYRIRAYRNAAQTVAGLSRSVAEMVKAGEDLSKLPGIGSSLADHIVEIVQTGRFQKLEDQKKKTPAALITLLKIPGFGPKRVALVYKKLKVKSLKELEKAVREGKLKDLPGFGEKIQQKILQHLQKADREEKRFLLAVAEQLVEPLVVMLQETSGVEKVQVAGSYRRRKETVGDADILVTGRKGSKVMDRFTEYEDVAEVLSRGETRSSVVLRSGLQVDLRFVPRESYGAALHYFTGSKAHNVAIRTRGVKRGLKINEYGIFKGRRRVGGEHEEEVFEAVGLPFIEPELRENQGEIEAAEAGKLPKLVRLEDIRGDLHCHTTATDGRNSLLEMAEAARARGYEYLAICDHSKRVAMARGLDATRLAKQIKEIAKVNARFRNFRLLKSIEVDILEDGSLDLPDSILKELDLVVAAVHYGTKLSRDKQTARILKAMDNPYVTIIAHPTGRIINERDPYEIDMERVLKGAEERGCFVELNANPNRLDLNEVYCRMAKELGVKVAVSTDAHSVEGLNDIKYGVGQARRGGLEAADVLNTRRWPELRKLIRKRR